MCRKCVRKIKEIENFIRKNEAAVLCMKEAREEGNSV